MFTLLPTRRKSQRVDHPHRGPVRRRKLVAFCEVLHTLPAAHALLFSLRWEL